MSPPSGKISDVILWRAARGFLLLPTTGLSGKVRENPRSQQLAQRATVLHVCLFRGADRSLLIYRSNPLQGGTCSTKSPSLLTPFPVAGGDVLPPGRGGEFCFSGYVPLFLGVHGSGENSDTQLLGEIKTKHLEIDTSPPIKKVNHQPTNKKVLQTKLHLFL